MRKEVRRVGTQERWMMRKIWMSIELGEKLQYNKAKSTVLAIYTITRTVSAN